MWLPIGEESLAPVPGICEEGITHIPENLINTIFDKLREMTIEDLSKRVIFAPIMTQFLGMSSKIINLAPGEVQIY